MLKLNNGVVKTEVDGEIVLMDTNTGTYFGLNEVGSRMLELSLTLDNKELVVQQLLEEYDIDAAEARNDLDEFITALLSKGLVTEQNH